jgi:hypothetical protein
LRHFFLISFSLSLLGPLSPALAVSPSIVLSELQTGTPLGASQEFIELYNPASTDTLVEGWSIQYKSSSSTDQPSSWTKRAVLSGTIKAHSFFLAAPKAYLASADTELSTGLAATGGHVRLVDANGVVIDLLGWGTANAPETAAADAPPAGQSLERLAGLFDESGGNAVDTDDNSADFHLRQSPQAQSSLAPPEEPTELGTLTDLTMDSQLPVSSSSDPEAPPAENIPSDIVITELLVDPAPPQSDAQDEFIELNNTGDSPINLEGYRLQTGKNFHDSYTVPSQTIEPGEYLAVYSRDSKLALTNSGGAARLLDPAGQVVSLVNYEKATAGRSWAQFISGWEWTTQPTPGKTNTLVAPPSAQKSAKGSKSAASSTKKSAKSSASKAGSVKTLSAQTSGGPLGEEGPPSAPPAKWLLITAIALTMGYALYEFRHDLQNYYYLARRKLSFRRKNRPAA